MLISRALYQGKLEKEPAARICASTLDGLLQEADESQLWIELLREFFQDLKMNRTRAFLTLVAIVLVVVNRAQSQRPASFG